MLLTLLLRQLLTYLFFLKYLFAVHELMQFELRLPLIHLLKHSSLWKKLILNLSHPQFPEFLIAI